METKKLGIIGVGRVGGALKAAFEVKTKDNVLLLHSSLGIESKVDVLEAAEIIFITVPDRFIESVANKIAKKLGGKVNGKTFFHCSGALELEALASLEKLGARIGSIHPLQSFQKESKADIFEGIFMALDYNEEKTKKTAEDLVNLLGAKPFLVPKKQRKLYHAAACIASNYVVTTLDLAEELMATFLGNKKDASLALKPLFRGTANNLLEGTNARSSLTGPIARGDYKTVKEHLLVMPENMQNIYRLLGLETVKIAKKNGTINSSQAQEMIELLEKDFIKKN